MGQTLINQHFGKQVKEETTFKDDGSYYKLLEDDDTNALNSGATSPCQPRPGKTPWFSSKTFVVITQFLFSSWVHLDIVYLCPAACGIISPSFQSFSTSLFDILRDFKQ